MQSSFGHPLRTLRHLTAAKKKFGYVLVSLSVVGMTACGSLVLTGNGTSSSPLKSSYVDTVRRLCLASGFTSSTCSCAVSEIQGKYTVPGYTGTEGDLVREAANIAASSKCQSR